MATRRSFLKQAALLAAGSAGALAGAGAVKANPPAAGKSPQGGRDAIAEGGLPVGRVPDTLDLAERGRLSLGALLGSLDRELNYECYFVTFYDVHPAYMLHWSTMLGGVMTKYVEALPLVRLMSGSQDGMDLQNGFMEAMLRNAAEDGLIYDRAVPSRPWNTGVQYGVKNWDEDYAHMGGNGRFLAGLTHWHQWTGDPKWQKLAQKTAERMLDLAIVRGDMAYYPNPGLGNDFSYPRVSGWGKHTNPPEKPDEGVEGATLACLFMQLRGFTRYYALSGDERFLELSRKLLNCGMQAKFWGANHDMNPAAGAQRAHFKGHYHGNLVAVRGLLDYALAANDSRLKLFARDAYDWARQNGIHRLGLFPANGNTEGCAIADMVGLAITLTDAGLGDYWDDVEQYVRNGLAEAQPTDRAELLRVSELGRQRPQNAPWGSRYDDRFSGNNKGVLKGQETTDRVIDRTIGSLGIVLQRPCAMKSQVVSCCTVNGAQAFYYAWEAIVRARDDATAEVNLWLNRRSPWCDVWSWLPYTGKLLVQNKGMRRLVIRKPGWARASTVRCRVDGHDVQPVWLGNRMLFDGLKGNEQIEVLVPVTVEKAEYSVVDLNYRDSATPPYLCEFKGDTAIRVVPSEPVDDRPRYRIFRREAMRGDVAPMKPVAEYVHPAKLVQWEVL